LKGGIGMKCLACKQADFQTEVRDLSYEYKGQTTMIRNMHVHHCLRCGAELLASGCVPDWVTQKALFRASVDASTRL
jgi:YgiT-type zinc finger domain-containing protein